MPAIAQARIVPGRSIAGVKVGMTKRQVKHKLGKPSQVGCIDRQGVGDCTRRQIQFGYRSNKLIVTFVAGKVADIKTSLRSQRARKGIHAGSSRRQVKKAYPDAKVGVYNSLFVPREPTHKGQRYTTFTFFGGHRVDSIIVGRYDRRDFCVFGCG